MAREAGAADRGEEGFDRHLLHRRARFPRVPRRATCRRSPARSAASDGARRRRASGRVLFHPRPARGPEHRRRARPRRGAVVRGRQGCRAQRAGRRPGQRQPLAAVERAAVASRRTGSPARRPRRASNAPRRPATASTKSRARCAWTTTAACEVRFARPQRAVTPGQSLVLYRRRRMPRRRGDRRHRCPAGAPRRQRTRT